MTSLADKLKSMGVKLGAEEMPKPHRKAAPALDKALDGHEIETPQGSTFVAEARYQMGHQHHVRRAERYDMRLSEEAFGELVEQALATVPDDFRAFLEGVAVDIESVPGDEVCRELGLRDSRSLLGLYRGTPLSKRHVAAPYRYPDRIVIYQRITMPETEAVAPRAEDAAGPSGDAAEPAVDEVDEQPVPRAVDEDRSPARPEREPPEAFALSAQTGRITALAFDPSGRFLAGASEDLSVIVWDVVERRSVLATTDHDQPVMEIAFSADGSLLATNGDDGKLVIVDRATGRIADVLRHGFTSLSAMALGPEAEIIALACDDLTVRTYRRDGPELHTHRGTTGAFGAVAFSADGTLLAGGSEHGGVYLWDVVSGELITRFTGLRENIIGLGFSASGGGGQLIAITQTGAGMVWAIETDEEAGRPLAAGIGDLIAVSFDPTGRWLACASNNQIMVWDIASHRPAGRAIRIGDGETMCGLAVAPDGRWCATGSAGGAIHLRPIPERW